MYFPLSQITPNLYTNGSDYVFLNDTKTFYKGYYFKTASEKSYTGKTPNNSSKEIVLASSINTPLNTPPNPEDLVSLNNIEQLTISQPNLTSFIASDYPFFKTFNRTIPQYVSLSPTNENYQQGYFTRYFCKKTNEFTYLEIDKDTYDKLKKKDPKILHQLYKPFELKWQLTGNKEMVYKTNKNLVDTVMRDQKMYLLNKYLKENYTQFWKSN